jgi:L-ribulose-5-phosphate 4-epimerase
MTPTFRQQVLEANRDLARHGLARFTFGNASAIDRAKNLVFIKPSGVPYESLTLDTLVVTDTDGRAVEGTLRPSSDLPTHLELYRAFPKVGGIVHTHSHFATVWAQARRPIPCLGTTHADHFHGAIPVTHDLGTDEILEQYEVNTGRAIVRCFEGSDPLDVPAVLVAGHASFCWGRTVGAAVEIAVILEEVAAMAYHTHGLGSAMPLSEALLDKHFRRKHGPEAYYGQGRGAKGER